MARSRRTPPAHLQTSLRAFAQGGSEGSAAAPSTNPRVGPPPPGGSADPSDVQPPAHGTTPASSGQTAEATRVQDSTGTSPGSRRSAASNPYLSSRSKTSTSRSDSGTAPPRYTRTSPVTASHQGASARSSTASASTLKSPSAPSKPDASSVHNADLPPPSPAPSPDRGQQRENASPSTQPGTSSAAVPPPSSDDSVEIIPAQPPIATLSERDRHPSVYSCSPDDLLTQLLLRHEHLGSEDSDVEVSVRTAQTLLDTSATNLVLQDPDSSASLGDVKLRRLLFGNARLPLNEAVRFSLPFILRDWYSMSHGKDVSGIDGTEDPKPCNKAPLLPDSALFRNICGILYYLPPREDSSSDGSLCFLRAPVDYAPDDGVGGIYGLLGLANAQTRFKNWTPQAMWQGESRCTKLTFANDDGHREGTSCGWDRMVLSSVDDWSRMYTAIDKEVDKDTAYAIVRPSFPDVGLMSDAAAPLCSENRSKKNKVNLCLFPRVFPVPVGGDIPGDLELFFQFDDARDCIAKWRGENIANPDTYSHVLDDVLASPTFCAWLSAVIRDSTFFEAEEMHFWPNSHDDLNDCTAALLVSRRVGLDIIEFCSSNLTSTHANMKRNFPGVNVDTCRDFSSLSNVMRWPPVFRPIMGIPPLLDVFPQLSRVTPVIDVDPGMEVPPATKEAPPPPPASPSVQPWRAPTPMNSLPSRPPRSRPDRPTIARTAPPLQPPHPSAPSQPLVGPSSSASRQGSQMGEALSHSHMLHGGVSRTAAVSSHDTGLSSGPSSTTRFSSASPMRDPIAAFEAAAALSPARSSAVHPTLPFRTPAVSSPAISAQMSTNYWREKDFRPSYASSFSSEGLPSAIDAANPATTDFFGLASTVSQDTTPYGGVAVANEGVTPPLVPPALEPLLRLNFLGAISPSGRQGHLVVPHAIFRGDGDATAFLTSTVDAGPYLPAPLSTVLLPGFDSRFLAGFPPHDRGSKHGVSEYGRRFEHFVANNVIPALTEHLRGVSHECGFFSESTLNALRYGCVLSSEIIPGPTSLDSTLSVFSFLRFRPGIDNAPLLPFEGWSDVGDAPRFVAALQWFIIDLFGASCGQQSLCYKALDRFRKMLELPSFKGAWDSIHHRKFSFFVVYHIHRLWIMMSVWEEGATTNSIYYRTSGPVMKIRGAAPFTVHQQSSSVDAFLDEWVRTVDRRFPYDSYQQINAFNDNIPHVWDSIFLPPPPALDTPSPDSSPTKRQRSEGDPNFIQSRSWNGAILVRRDGHRDTPRVRTRQFINAVSPLPTFRCKDGKSITICMGQNVLGLKCPSFGKCARMHLNPKHMSTVPREAVASIHAWLQRDAVKSRVHLSAAALKLKCFQD